MTVEIYARDVIDLVDPSVHVEKLADGFEFLEGPVWCSSGGGYLLFSDIPAGKRYRWDAATGITEVASETNKGNGMTFDADGRLLVCEHATSVISRSDANGTGDKREVIASHYQGRELNSPNDVIVGADGSVYFTDPAPGRTSPEHGLVRPRELNFLGVFRRLPETGDLQLIADDFDAPNGLCLSPDERILYVNDTVHSHIRAFEPRDDGSFADLGVMADGIGTFRPGPQAEGLVDGMKCDVLGNVWITGPRGIWIISSRGEHLGTVEIPDFATNLHWGGERWNWLYVACVSGLYRFETRVSGRLEPFMR